MKNTGSNEKLSPIRFIFTGLGFIDIGCGRAFMMAFEGD